MNKKFQVCIRTLLVVTLLAMMGCGQQASKKDTADGGKKILPNPRKFYEDQCYVWLKEFPHFFRERHDLTGGYAWDRHSYQGVYVSDNPKSMFYSRHYVGQTVLLFKPDKPGGGMHRDNIIYQYSLSQGNDGDLDQIWLLGEYRPPNDCKQWVLAGTGKHRGVRAEGVWHWFWPENRNWEKPENPPGYDYPNAEEFNYKYPEKTDGEPEMVGYDYWIEEPPYGSDITEPLLGLPATEKPEKTERIIEKGYFLIKKLPDLQQRQLIPAGSKGGAPEETTGFDHYNFEGIYVSENPGSPFHQLPIYGKLLALYTPVPGEDMHPGNLHCEFIHLQTGKPDGDQVWWLGESFPPKKPQLTLKVATGRYEGLSGIGTWFYEWPKGHVKPVIPKGYNHALACEFIFDMPVK